MKWKWDTDRIVGLGAMAVGVAEGQEPGASDKAVIFVTYSSVYGETWHLRSDSFVPAPGATP